MSRDQRNGDYLKYFLVSRNQPSEWRYGQKVAGRRRFTSYDGRRLLVNEEWEKAPVKYSKAHSYYNFSRVVSFLENHLNCPRDEVLSKIQKMRPRHKAQMLFDDLIHPVYFDGSALYIQGSAWRTPDYFFCPIRGTLQSFTRCSRLSFHDLVEFYAQFSPRPDTPVE